jgi:hypothetical protein
VNREAAWDELYAHLVVETGWTWEYIDERVTLPRLSALIRYWGEHPPVSLLVRQFLGHKPRRAKAPGSPKDLDAFIKAFSAMGGTIN